MAEITVDCRGETCPVPLVEVRKALRQASSGDVIEVLGTHPSSRKEIPMAAEALGLIQQKPELTVPALIMTLESDEDFVRKTAATALGRFGKSAESAIPALKKARNHNNRYVREEAEKALARIRKGE